MESNANPTSKDGRLALWPKCAMHMVKLRKAVIATTAGILVAHLAAKLGMKDIYCIVHLGNLQIMNDARDNRFSASSGEGEFSSLCVRFWHLSPLKERHACCLFHYLLCLKPCQFIGTDDEKESFMHSKQGPPRRNRCRLLVKQM